MYYKNIKITEKAVPGPLLAIVPNKIVKSFQLKSD